MVRISSKLSHRRAQPKKKTSTPPIEIPLNPVDQSSSSSKILSVVRQALLNAAEELVSQQQESNNAIPFHTLDINESLQRNGNSIKKKKSHKKRKKFRKSIDVNKNFQFFEYSILLMNKKKKKLFNVIYQEIYHAF